MTPQFLRFQNTCLNTIFAGLQFLQFHCDQSETISTEYNFNRRAERASEKNRGILRRKRESCQKNDLRGAQIWAGKTKIIKT